METWSEMPQLSKVESLPVDDRRKWKRLTTDSALSSPHQKNRPTSKRELPSIHYLYVRKIIMWTRKLSTSPPSSNKSNDGITSGENVCANESNELPHHSDIGFMKNIDQGLGSVHFGELWYRLRTCSTPTS